MNIIQLGFLDWDFFKWTSFLINRKIVILTIRMLAANSHCFHQKMFILVTGLQTGLPPETQQEWKHTAGHVGSLGQVTAHLSSRRRYSHMQQRMRTMALPWITCTTLQPVLRAAGPGLLHHNLTRCLLCRGLHLFPSLGKETAIQCCFS